MNSIDLILLDLKECRRRFINVAKFFPDELLTWRPDVNALSIGETIRHVLLHDFSWLILLKENRLPSEEEYDELAKAPYNSVENEIEKFAVYQIPFLNYVSSLHSEELETRNVSWPHRPITRTLGDTLERKAYHDAVHTGQLLQYLRMLQLDRPNIWD